MPASDFVLAKRLSRWRAYRRLRQRATHEALLSAVRFSFEHNERLPLHLTRIRHMIAICSPWHFEDAKLLQFVMDEFRNFLFSGASNGTALDWQAWIKSCNANSATLDVLDPVVAKALHDAQIGGKLDRLQSDERRYLLSCYKSSYGDPLSNADTAARPELLAMLLDFAAIGRLLPDLSIKAVLREWASKSEARPRCLNAIDDDHAFQSPIRGVGSPNGVVVTQFSADGKCAPECICIAGTTPDQKFNAHLFNTIFATALACECEPTLVTSGASVLTLGKTDLPHKIFAESLLPVPIGPAGPVEPGSGPAISMDPMESMLFANETFDAFNRGSGLVRLFSRSTHERIEFDGKFRKAIADPHNSTIDCTAGDPQTAVHLTPLLHRDEHGVVPAKIEIPYDAVGGIDFFRLLCNTRSAYMRQLIEETKRRMAVAWEAYHLHRRHLEEWRSLPEQEKVTRTNGQFLTITGQYDFRRGIVIPLDKPNRIPQRQYEDDVRPNLVEGAKQYGEAFQRLCSKLQSLDAPGGRADMLTLKLLMDSMIRNAPLQVDSNQLREQFKEWAEDSSKVAWSAIEIWARQHNISTTFLASDFVIFNTSLKIETKAIVIQPWIVVDLHDFRAIIENGSATMWPAGKARRFSDAIQPCPQVGISSLSDLRRLFDDWVFSILQPAQSGAISDKTAMHDRKIQAVVELQRAKNLLLHGLPEEALARLNAVRNADLAVIYLWCAIACEVKVRTHRKSLAPQYGYDASGNLQISQGESRHRLLLSESLEAVRIALMQRLAHDPFSAQNSRLLISDANGYLDQLRAKSPALVEALVKSEVDLPSLERKSLRLSKEEWDKVEACLASIGALECLELAQKLSVAAKALPAFGSVTKDVKDEVRNILAAADRVSACEIPDAAQLKTLHEFLLG